jgi:hypothetical protein
MNFKKLIFYIILLVCLFLITATFVNASDPNAEPEMPQRAPVNPTKAPSSTITPKPSITPIREAPKGLKWENIPIYGRCTPENYECLNTLVGAEVCVTDETGQKKCGRVYFSDI